MPVDQIVQPGVQEGETYIASGTVVQTYIYDPAQVGNLVNGNLVSVEALTFPSQGPALIKKSTTTADAFMLGVVINAPTGGYTPGSVVMVQTEGFCLALFDAHNTTAGGYGLQSVTTAGSLVYNAAATNALTMCVVLENVTIASGTALVPVYLHRM
jgi:hypothetical protein